MALSDVVCSVVRSLSAQWGGAVSGGGLELGDGTRGPMDYALVLPLSSPLLNLPAH